MNIQDQIDKLKLRIDEIRATIATEKCDYKLEYQNLYKLEDQLRKLILASCQQ